jgi:hypothetical protein
MNRVKLWLYLVLLLCAGAANLIGLSRWLTHRAIGQMDRELSRAVSHVDARSQLLAAGTAQLADAVARDPAVLQALSSEEGTAASAAQSAAQSARGAADAAHSQLVATWGRGGRTLAVNGAPVQADPHLEGLLSGAADGAVRREAYAVVGDALYYLVAAPAGRGTAVAVGVPVNAAWLAVLRAATGSEVTLLLEQRPPQGTLPAEQAQQVAKAVRGAPGPVGVGRLASQPAVFGAAFPSPALPLLFASAPAYRAHPVALRGLEGGVLVLSQPTNALLAPVIAYQWVLLAGLVILLLVGVGTGLMITNEQQAMVPKDLVSAADRITRRDFAARAPAMAGSLGTVATALNCAAEAAQGAGAARPEPGLFSAPALGAVAEAPSAADDDAGPGADVFAAFSRTSSAAVAAAAPESGLPEQAPSAGAPADLLDAFSRASSAADAAAAPEPAAAEHLPAADDSGEPADLLSAFSRISSSADAAATSGAAANEPAAPEPQAEELAALREPAAAQVQTAGWPFAEEEPAAAHEPATLMASAVGGEEVAARGEALEQAATSGLPSSGESLGESFPTQEPAASPEPAAAPEVFATAEAAGSALAAFAARLEQQAAAAHQEAEPASPALGEPAPDNGVTQAPGPTSSVFEASSSSLAAASESRPAYEPTPEPPPELAGALAAEPAPIPEPDVDEEHWRITYDEFLKVREQCGESRQTVPYDRFRQKLLKNRDQLVAKYGCRTVRFQVYVKEAKAALKASPVR